MRYARIENGVIDSISFEHQDNPWVAVADGVFAGYVQNNDGTFSAPVVAPEPVLSGQVNAERDKRIALGFNYGPHRFDFDTASKSRITGAATLAGFAMGAGAQAGNFLWHGGTDPFTWILQDNTTLQIDAPTMFQIGQVAANWEASHITAARALKDADPIPADYTDDAYWP